MALERIMIRITLLACALLVPSWVTASDEPASFFEAERYVDVARWMIEQPAPEIQAAGLARLAESRSSGAAGIEPDRFLEKAAGLLRDEPSGAVVYMLARGCAAADLAERCEALGIREAIDRHDGGNPLAAGFLHEADSAAYRDTLIAATRVDDHYPELVSAWFEAFRTRPPEDMPKDAALFFAFAMATADVTAIDKLMQRCRASDENDQALDGACRRLSREMREGRTFLLQNIGFGLARARAQRLGNSEEVAELQREQEALHHRLRCLVEFSDPALSEASEAFQTRFLEVFVERGELAAQAFAAGDASEKCLQG